MRKFLLLCGFCGLFACRNKENSNLKLTFKPVFNGQPLVLFSDIQTPTGDTVNFQKLEFFISSIKGVTSGGKTVDFLVKDAALISFNNLQTLAQALAGVSTQLSDIAPNEYSKIQIGIGVVSDLNNKTPDAFKSSSPLYDDANYWSTWQSYIFSRVEGNMDTSRNSSSLLSFLYHGGINNMYQSREFTKTFSLVSEQTQELVFEVDAQKIFYPSTGNNVNVRGQNVSHGAALGTPAYNIGAEVFANLANAIRVL
jgi:hypothetical protein